MNREKSFNFFRFSIIYKVTILFLILFGAVILYSVSKNLFPLYFVYIISALVIFYLFSKVDFEVLTLFSAHSYAISVFLLLITLIIGKVTRGTIRWIPLGPISIQPSEIVRPFLILFLAKYITEKRLTLKRFIKATFLFAIPIILIFVQPSLGVAVLTALGFLGVIFSSPVNKKYFLLAILVVGIVSPIVWKVLAPYQRQRIITFVYPTSDPRGAGYNSIQSMIAVGDGGVFGRGLGKGSQTQLAFLPEKQTDFVFAATAEELGFFGVTIILSGLFILFWCLTEIIQTSINPTARAFVSGTFLILLAETLVHVGMNIGLLPITGVPLPLISSGGSAMLGTMMSLALALKAKKED